jgi:hypothetical protein
MVRLRLFATISAIRHGLSKKHVIVARPMSLVGVCLRFDIFALPHHVLESEDAACHTSRDKREARLGFPATAPLAI